MLMFISGTTWVSQIISLMLAGEGKYEKIKQIPLAERVLYLEQNFPDKDMAKIEILDTVPLPRAVKTHLP